MMCSSMQYDIIFQMDVKKFMEYMIDEYKEIQTELVNDLQKVCHSPNELGFLAGRIAELNDQIAKLEYYLDQWEISKLSNEL